MHAGELRRVGLAADAGANTLHLVGGQGDAHAGAADGDAQVRLAVRHRAAHLLPVDRVVAALPAVGAQVDHIIAQFNQIIHNDIF